MRRALPVLTLICLWASASVLRSAEDDTFDFLVGKAATRPTTQPAEPTTRPVSPFVAKEDGESRPGMILLSDGKKLRGRLSTTREKPIRVFASDEKEYRDIPFSLIRSMGARVLWEREQKEWHFKESGSDVKEYSGKTYPAREIEYIVKLVNGQTVTGGIVAPLYVLEGETKSMHVLNKRQKGEIGQTLKDLVYIRRVELE